MSKLQFKPKDFANLVVASSAYENDEARTDATRLANAALARMLRDAPVVYVRRSVSKFWGEYPDEFATHRALLVNIEPLPVKPCEHVPITLVPNIYQGQVGMDYFDKVRCKHCGVKLQATWTVADET